MTAPCGLACSNRDATNGFVVQEGHPYIFLPQEKNNCHLHASGYAASCGLVCSLTGCHSLSSFFKRGGGEDFVVSGRWRASQL